MFLSVAMAVCLLAQPALAQTEVVPVQMNYHDGITGLKRWTRSPVLHSDNRIVPREARFGGARVLTVNSPDLDVEIAVLDGLARDGVTDATLTTVQEVQGAPADAFRAVEAGDGATFFAWIASGSSDAGPVKIAGFAVVTPMGDAAGTAVKMFVAPVRAYTDLGGWVVPTVRYFGLKVEDPRQDMRALGSMEDPSAVLAMAGYFAEWMAMTASGDDMATIGTVDALGIPLGAAEDVETKRPEPVLSTSN